MTDPLDDLAHDHADINRRVLAVGASIRALDCEDGNGLAVALASQLDELREMMFLHFAREEEGLFPFVSELVPDLADQVRAMELAHDSICGGLARMCHLATANAEPAVRSAAPRRPSPSRPATARPNDAPIDSPIATAAIRRTRTVIGRIVGSSPDSGSAR